MTSHGVARTVRFRTDEQRQHDIERIQKYRSLEDQVRLQTVDSHYGQETFHLTSKLLRLNPEYYSIWNVRRRCLISGLLSKPSAGLSPSKASPSISATDTLTTSFAASLPSCSTETQQAPNPPTVGKSGTIPELESASAADDASRQEQDITTIRTELAFTIPLLMEFPKCYWIWNYRLWILQQATERFDVTIARRIWEEELGLVSRMLTRDRRNFHAWGYRRHVVTQLESQVLDGRSMVEPEFEYTTKMIHVDLSNFSAWHNRSQLIPRLLDERKADDASRKSFLDKELDLVREALNVGPEDQSLWFYHQYLVLNLVGQTGISLIAPKLTIDERKAYILHEIVDIKDLLEDYADIKWIYEALVEYTTALWQLTGQAREDEEQRDVAQWLGRLRALDPMRNGRWVDLETQLNLASSTAE
ncbi:Rab geranylgeranyltransferase [Neonectria magnoliae]|uniref:Geranylgeranyl transferase type-2 subunit alpha n=1 Tax=Neonectria magnoliae TaxID=2732573 RepID=A0ABR1H648_9HYPO